MTLPGEAGYIDSRLAAAASRFGVDAEALDEHVEAVHGWEPHNDGYIEAVEAAARCLTSGGCE